MGRERGFLLQSEGQDIQQVETSCPSIYPSINISILRRHVSFPLTIILCSDKLKVSSEKNLFKLVAVDLFEVPDTTQNIASNPKNRSADRSSSCACASLASLSVCMLYDRVFQALQRGDTTWVFVMNIMVPGPPNLSFVAYWEADRVRAPDSDYSALLPSLTPHRR